MMKISQLPNLSKYKIFLFPGVVIILIVISIVVIIKPRVSEILASRRDLGEQKQELALLSQKVATLEGYDQNELQERTDQILEVLPAEKNGPLLFATLRSLSNEHNLSVESLTIDIGEVSTDSATPTTEKEKLPPLGIELDVSGTLNDLYDFLGAVETTAPIFKIDQISITREGTSIEAQVNFLTYYLAIPNDIGKVDRQIVPISSVEERVYQELSAYQLVPAASNLPSVSSGKEDLFAF